MNRSQIKSMQQDIAFRPIKNAFRESLATSPFPVMKSIGGATLFFAGTWSIMFLASLKVTQ